MYCTDNQEKDLLNRIILLYNTNRARYSYLYLISATGKMVERIFMKLVRC